MKKVPFYDLKVTDGFWAAQQKLVREKTVWAVYDRFEETGRIATMDGKSHGFEPHIFWGSDVVKWLEGVAYLLEEQDEPKLRELAEKIIDDIEAAQDADGYYNSYFCNPEAKWPRFSERDKHELYSLGHMIEAAVAWYHATGEDRLLQICCRNVELVDRVFRREKSAGFVTPGHQEIELALLRLYEVTGNPMHRDLAEFFIRERGIHPKDISPERYANDGGIYLQGHLPVVEQTTAVGHAVRALYLYCGMADLAKELGDEKLQNAVETLFNDIYEKKMYITGGLGSQHQGERFTVAYHLPNRKAYAETCAALALALFGRRLYNQKPDGRYGDAVERALYNGMISGLSLDGESFFYVNPLEMDLSRMGIPGEKQAKTQRQRVFNCSCCPPNLVRLIPAIGEYVYGYDRDTLFVHQYIPTEGTVEGAAVKMETAYPLDGTVKITYEGDKKLALRKPAWCGKFTASAPCREEKGYLYFDTNEVAVTFEMEPIFYTASDAVHEDAGRVALMRGPIVYCLEGQDQPGDLFRCRVDPEGKVKVLKETFGGSPILVAEGVLLPVQKSLYAPYQKQKGEPVTLRYIPYYAFANRGEDDMQVWPLSV